MTAKQIAGYLKARRDQRGSTFGGITFNDGYNVPTFGITKAVYDAISRAMSAEYGAFGEPTNLTPAVVKKALKNHLERGGTLHHATKKSPAQLQREIDEALSRSSQRRQGAVAHYNVPMKWSAWSADRDTWNEYPEGSGFLHSLDALGEEGTAVEVTTSSSKEGRHGKITVTGRPGAYKAVGHFAAELDDGTMEHVTVNETARSINKLLAAVDGREQELIDAMA